MNSAILRKKVHLEVVLPSEKLPESGVFPVVWLFHGLSDDDSSWHTLAPVTRYAVDCGFAVVMPDCARSFYADMASGPRYWSFISEELPAVCRCLFPLSENRNENFVAGLSMGGYGALKLALNYPDRFAGVAAFSAVADIIGWLDDIAITDSELAFEMKMIFANRDSIKNSGSDLFELIRRRKEEKVDLPAIFHACGTEDFLYRYNTAFRDHVNKLGVENYNYLEESGSHDWKFWDRNIERAFKFFKSL